MNVGTPNPQATAFLSPPALALPLVLSTQLPISAPLTSLDECFFFKSLVVGLSYSPIFCQFWLLFVFKLVVVLLLVVRRGTVSTYTSIFTRSLGLSFHFVGFLDVQTFLD